ncbi:MAG: rhodanese-like domain-containing protein [Acidimicrobiales bacterium]
MEMLVPPATAWPPSPTWQTPSGRPASPVLDVRRRDEWDAGHMREAMHIPFYELEDRIGEVPDAPEVWVHCASGFRASVGSSLLDRAGRRAVLIDDDWDRASEAGPEVTRG